MRRMPYVEKSTEKEETVSDEGSEDVKKDAAAEGEEPQIDEAAKEKEKEEKKTKKTKEVKEVSREWEQLNMNQPCARARARSCSTSPASGSARAASPRRPRRCAAATTWTRGPTMKTTLRRGKASRAATSRQLFVGILSLLCMWILIVAKPSSSGNALTIFAGLDPLHAQLPIITAPMFYTSLTGLPAFIWTDLLQCEVMVVFTPRTLLAYFPKLDIGSAERGPGFSRTGQGFESS